VKYLVIKADDKPVGKTWRHRGLSTGTRVQYGPGDPLRLGTFLAEGIGILFAPSLVWPKRKYGPSMPAACLDDLPYMHVRPTGPAEECSICRRTHGRETIHACE
jgi:hypothetical protein